MRAASAARRGTPRAPFRGLDAAPPPVRQRTCRGGRRLRAVGYSRAVSSGDPQPATAQSRTTALRQGLRFFAAPADEPRARRATDILLLVPTLIGLAILIALQPPGPVETSLISFLASFPAEL